MSDSGSETSSSTTSSSATHSETPSQEWFMRHPVTYSCSSWPNREFKQFMGSLKYPKVIKSDTILDKVNSRLSRNESERIAVKLFEHWRKRLRPDQLEDADPYGLQIWLSHITSYWRSHDYKLEKRSNPASCRKAIDDLLELAFELRDGADQIWQSDYDLALPGNPDSVKADAVMTMEMPELWQVLLNGLSDFYTYSWSFTNEPQSVITFVLIAKDENAQRALRRLQRCFYSAQLHRRALCCKEAPVFGAIQHDKSLRFYVSFWQGDTLAVRPILRRYPLVTFANFVEIYFVLCRISEFQSVRLQKDFKRWSEDVQLHLRELSDRPPWRKEERETENSDHGQSEADAEEEALEGKDVLVPVFDSKREENGYLLRKKNLKAFDVTTDAKETEKYHSVYAPSEWVEETHRHEGEYEDPAPYLPEDAKGGDAITPYEMSGPKSGDDPVMLNGETLTGDGKRCDAEGDPGDAHPDTSSDRPYALTDCRAYGGIEKPWTIHILTPKQAS